MDFDKIQHLLGMWLTYRAEGDLVRAAFWWKMYLDAISPAARTAIMAAGRAAGVYLTEQEILAAELLALRALAAAGQTRVAQAVSTRAFCRALASTMGKVPKVPGPVMIGIVGVGLALTLYNEQKKAAANAQAYSQYLVNYVAFTIKARAIHPNAIINEPMAPQEFQVAA